MNICSPQLGMSPVSNLGGEVHDREILLSLARLGQQIYIILPLGKSHPDHPNFHFYYLPIPFVWPPYLFNFLILPYLWWIYLRHPYKILRIHSPYFVGLGALVFKILVPKVTLVATYHHVSAKKIYQFLDQLLLPRFDKIITVSQGAKKQLLPLYNLQPDNIEVIYNGVLLKARRTINTKLFFQYNLTGKNVLIYLGQLIKRKNLTFLFPIIKKLPDTVLLIGGRGDNRINLEKAVHRLRIENKVVFAGFIPEDQKSDFIKLGDLFVLPSLAESFSLACAEALSCGVPVVCSNFSGATEVVTDHKDGYVLPLTEILWLRTLSEFLSRPKLQNSFRRYARKKAAGLFSWEAAGQKYLEILQNL